MSKVHKPLILSALHCVREKYLIMLLNGKLTIKFIVILILQPTDADETFHWSVFIYIRAAFYVSDGRLNIINNIIKHSLHWINIFLKTVTTKTWILKPSWKWNSLQNSSDFISFSEVNLIKWLSLYKLVFIVMDSLDWCIYLCQSIKRHTDPVYTGLIPV